MNTKLKLTNSSDSYIFKNLWPLYQHDCSEFDSGFLPNRHGLFNEDDSIRTLDAHSEKLSPWLEAPDHLFPYLILQDDLPAGFNLIASGECYKGVIDADYLVHEFFVMHAYRGKGVAECAAREGFDLHRGKWEIITWPNHARGIAFWRRVVKNYSSNGYTEDEIDHPWGRKVVFHFDNTLI